MRETAFKNDGAELWTFGQELSFFSKYGIDAVLLGEGKSFILVSPSWQGRVFTSTLDGSEGFSMGWINRDLIALKNEDLRSVHAGGEDRFLIGPEGGDFSVFFRQGDMHSEENWLVPEAFSQEPWKVEAQNKTQIKLSKETEFQNSKGFTFNVRAEREVSVLSRADIGEILGIEIPEGVRAVAFQSLNKLTNLGEKEWDPDAGLLNISVQSYFNANRKSRVFIPYRDGDMAKLGDIVRDNYFESGALGGGSRLLVESGYIELKTDGNSVSGIGVSPARSEGIVLSYDGANNILTVITYIKPSGKPAYLQNSWQRVSSPFDGDAISVYNNGPMARACPDDSFYEISTHSPALKLAPQKSQFHLQRTFHFSGSEYDLGLISYKLVGISIGQLRGKAE